MTPVSQDGPLRIGETFLGKYEIRKLIGRGGYARVYHAINHFLGSHVAIKVIWRDGGVDNEVLRRGQAEAQILNQLLHENVVRVIDAGKEGELLYIIMELLDGRSLRHVLLEYRRLAVEELLALAALVAEGVHAAHRIGVIHRDLKPENVYVLPSNGIKVLDFGIAKITGAASWTTQKGMAHGTPFYMSPEHMQAMPVGSTNDMYSLGIIMYEALIGHHPIRAQLSPSPNPLEVAHVVMHNELPMLDAIDPRIPPAVAALVARAINRNPKARFSSMKEFASAILDCRATWLAFAHAHGVPIMDRDLSQPSSETGRIRAEVANVRPSSANANANANAQDTEPFSRPLFLGAISSSTLEQRPAHPPSPIEDFAFEAADATTAGGSSLGAFVTSSKSVRLRRVSITAGKGKDGENGVGTSTAAATGATGNAGHDACAATEQPNPGGVAVTSMCDGVPSASIGGKGGDGGNDNSNAGPGDNGEPDLGGGNAGLGEANSGWSCSVGAGLGGATAGANGTSKSPMPGASTLGTLTSTGFAGTPGSDGENGTPGQGGGGGGGAKAPAITVDNPTPCGLTNPRTGASGGSGGGGGCGGKGGTGGKAGASSIALAVLDSKVTLSDVELIAKDGGKGGNGGVGQPGGNPGAPGDGGTAIDSSNRCPGGQGGKGGKGGSGGGAAGGISAGIVWHGGSAPTQTGLTFTEGAFGTKGIGGSVGVNDGIDGTTVDVMETP